MRTFFAMMLMTGACQLWAGEYAVLSTGFRVHAQRHVSEEGTITLYEADGNYSQFPAAAVTGFEPDEKLEAIAPAAKAAEDTATVTVKIAETPKPNLPELVAKASQEQGVHPALISSVIAAESAFRSSAVSPKGAVGLMQLMPETARDLHVTDRRDAAQNIQGGTSYLRQMLDRYSGFSNQLERALAAYNAGPAKVDRYGGVPPYRETVDFVSRVSTRLKLLLETR